MCHQRHGFRNSAAIPLSPRPILGEHLSVYQAYCITQVMVSLTSVQWIVRKGLEFLVRVTGGT